MKRLQYHTKNELHDERRRFDTDLFYLIAIFGTIFGLVIVICFDYQAVMDKGFFQGYSTVVWLVILLQVNKIVVYLILNSFIVSRQ